MDDKDDFNNNEDKKDEKIEVVVGDTSELAFSEVGDFMGDLKPKDIKGSKKNIIIPTNKKNVNSSDTNTDNNDTDSNNTENTNKNVDDNPQDDNEKK